MLYPGSVTSTKTGTRPAWMIGFTVVGKPAATVITSSPGESRLSPSVGEVRAETASRFAEEPELTSIAWRWPVTFARRFSNSAASGPAVSQKSRLVRTSSTTSSGPKTRPETGTDGSAGSNTRGAWRSAAYAATRARISSWVVIVNSSGGAKAEQALGCHRDRGSADAVVGEDVLARADLVRERVGQSDAGEAGRQAALGDRLGERAAEPAEDVVLLDRDDERR